MDALEKNKNIQTVRFEDIVIHEKEAAIISEMLKSKQSIKKLEMINCGLDCGAMIQIAQGLGLSR